MALAGSTGAKFYHVVVTLHKGHHAKERHSLGLLGHGLGLKTDGADEEVLPLLGREGLTALLESLNRIRARMLDRAKLTDLKGQATLGLRAHGIVLRVISAKKPSDRMRSCSRMNSSGTKASRMPTLGNSPR